MTKMRSKEVLKSGKDMASFINMCKSLKRTAAEIEMWLCFPRVDLVLDGWLSFHFFVDFPFCFQSHPIYHFENTWFIRLKWCWSYKRLAFVLPLFFQIHEADCGFMNVKCTNKGCKETPLQKHLQEHLNKKCVMRELSCRYCETSFIFCKRKVIIIIDEFATVRVMAFCVKL